MSKLNTESSKHNLVYWSILIVLFLFTLIAGSLGYRQYLHMHCESYDGIRHIYRTIQLFTSEGGDLELPIPLILHVVRFTALLTTFGAVFLALVQIFSDQWQRLRISFMRNHVVIIGLGTKGMNVLKENLMEGKNVLVVEKDSMNPHLASFKPWKPRRIIGDSTNKSILDQARIQHARKVYLLMGDDSQQITVCLMIYDIIKKKKKRKKNKKSNVNKQIKQCELSELIKMNAEDKQNRFSELSELGDQTKLSKLSEVCELCEEITKKNLKNSKSTKKQNDSLECIMHLMDQESLHTLRNNNLVQNVDDGLCLNVFNVYENGARELFQDHPPDRNGLSELSKEFVQLVIFGFGQAGEALALQTALTGHYLNWKRRMPRVVVFDRLATEKVQDFNNRYPTYTESCELIPVPMEAKSPRLLTELVQYLDTPDALSTVVLCFDNRTKNMLLGLQIANIKLKHIADPIPIFSRTDDDEAFESVINEDSVINKIKPYSSPSRVCSKNVIEGEDLDDMAKAYHKNYLKIRRANNKFGGKAADFCWERLSQEYRDSNRKAADHIAVKIRGIGCQIVSTENGDTRPEAKMSPYEIQLLSELEHRRWNTERSLAGWTYASDPQERTRKTPYLVDWSMLTPDIQFYDIDAVENIPEVLKIIKKKIVRT